jgi:hypothetical protein
MRIIAFITEAAPAARILTHIGEPAEPPPSSFREDPSLTTLAREIELPR